MTEWEIWKWDYSLVISHDRIKPPLHSQHPMPHDLTWSTNVLTWSTNDLTWSTNDLTWSTNVNMFCHKKLLISLFPSQLSSLFYFAAHNGKLASFPGSPCARTKNGKESEQRKAGWGLGTRLMESRVVSTGSLLPWSKIGFTIDVRCCDRGLISDWMARKLKGSFAPMRVTWWQRRFGCSSME